mgnify:CR=1 FL=1
MKTNSAQPDWLAVDYEPTLAERKLAAAKLRAMLEEELWRIEASKHEKMAAWSLLKRL